MSLMELLLRFCAVVRGRAASPAISVPALAAVLMVSGCESKSDSAVGAGNGKPVVLCTTTMIEDMAREVGGDRVRVIGIMPPGTDPHIYEPRPDDSLLMEKASLILYNGLHLEGRMVAMFERAGTKAVPLAEDPRIKLRDSETNQGAPDPHCWWNARYFMIYTERARDALIKMDPAGEPGYRERANGIWMHSTNSTARFGPPSSGFLPSGVTSSPATMRFTITAPPMG